MNLIRSLFIIASLLFLVACGGGSSSGNDNSDDIENPDPPVTEPEPIVITAAEASRFLSQATFGPSSNSIDNVLGSSPSEWFIAELEKPPTLHLDNLLSQFPDDERFPDERNNVLSQLAIAPRVSFWQAAIEGDDQLRQRMAFALSQIMVISTEGTLEDLPRATAQYMDILTGGAFDNYRNLLEQVTYSPAMAIYLTYLRNQKADPVQNRVPDENYAREVLQLFSLGLLELRTDGEPRLDSDGNEIELYDNNDITELAKVFTGLSFAGNSFTLGLSDIAPDSFYSPLQMFDDFHSSESKQFLGITIPTNTDGETSIDLALDAIFNHPNVGPFLGRQLIQRFITSAPSPAYVERVAMAFNSGEFTLPNGEAVGTELRGDLAATIAAVLFDDEARNLEVAEQPSFGKLREPVLRFTHWARAFEINSADSSNERLLVNTGSPTALGQQPYRSPSVFNFYRPGYIATGTETGDLGLTAPEMQITNADTVIGYANFITAYVLGTNPKLFSDQPRTFVADYTPYIETELSADDLLDQLDLLLSHDRLTEKTRQRITTVLDQFSTDNQTDRLLRVQAAIIMIITSPEYIVLR
jgi:uncharacterized protein (DUF1800 family)